MTLGLTRARLVHALFGTSLLLLPLAAIALVADLALGKAVRGTVTLMLINLIAVLGFGIHSGNTGIMSFGHVVFMSIVGGFFLAGIEIALRASLPIEWADYRDSIVLFIVIAVLVVRPNGLLGNRLTAIR